MKRTVFFAIIAFAAADGAAAWAGHCDVTVTAPGSIQDAIDTVVDTKADGKFVVCLDDQGGAFSQSVLFGPDDTGIRLTAAHDASPELDGTGPADPGTILTADAIELLDGARNITIDRLEIHDYTGASDGEGNAIQAWDVSTSNIRVRNNNMHDFSWNGIRVGSEGGFLHKNWMVRNNLVDGVVFAGIELTNCRQCNILANAVSASAFFGGARGIFVQARNTSTGFHVDVNGVNIQHNIVSDVSNGIRAESFTGHPTDRSPIANASSVLSSLNISNNFLTAGTLSVIRVIASNDGALVRNGRIIHNVINCVPGFGEISTGVQILELGGTVINAKIVNNTFEEDCNPPVTDQGVATKIPPSNRISE